MLFKMYRKKKGYSQETLAEIIGISIKQYQLIEADKYQPNLFVLANLIKELAINDQDIINYIKNFSTLS